MPDEIWRAAVPERFQKGAVCLQCFDKFAVERAIQYAHRLRSLYFAGEMAAFEFAVVKASNGPNGFG